MKRANLELKYKASLYVIYFFCKFFTKNRFIFCDGWQHFCDNPCYYTNRKNPPIHYIKFYYPHSKIPSPKEQRSIAVLLLYTKSLSVVSVQNQ